MLSETVSERILTSLPSNYGKFLKELPFYLGSSMLHKGGLLSFMHVASVFRKRFIACAPDFWQREDIPKYLNRGIERLLQQDVYYGHKRF